MERASVPIAQERVRRNSKKKRRDLQRRTRGSASGAGEGGSVLSFSTAHTNNGGLWGRCRGYPVSFLQLAVEPVPAAHWNGTVVQLRNCYRESRESCTRRVDPC